MLLGKRVDLMVIIVNYKETGLNTEQITSMLVEAFGGVGEVDPEDPRGLPYDPSIENIRTHGDINEINRIKHNFINLMHWCKVLRR